MSKINPDDSRVLFDSPQLALLIAELAVNDAWQLLIQLAVKMGMDEMAREFGNALREEEVHLTQIRQWYKQTVLEDAAVAS